MIAKNPGKQILTKIEMAEAIELWVHGVSLINIASKFKISYSSISRIIGIHYLGTYKNPVIIVKQSSINENINEGGNRQAA